MELTTFQHLIEPRGQIVLSAAAQLDLSEQTLLSVHQRLRKQFPEDLVKAAVETVLLRSRAKGKFTRADEMYFTRESLEQSTGEHVSNYRAERFAGFRAVGDFCCGIGGDAIGLALRSDLVAVDRDPVRLAMARENLRVYGRLERTTLKCANVLDTSSDDLEAAFFDPDRRADGRRHVRICEYEPPLEYLRARLPPRLPLGVKVAPGVPWDELHRSDAEAEFISMNGELKECVLWFGALKGVGRRATVLPHGATLAAEDPLPQAEPSRPKAYLYDPDPAIVRAGLVSNLGDQLGACPIDTQIAYLTSDRLTSTPFARSYAIDESMPFHAKRIGEQLRSYDVGHVTITKRGSAVDVDELRRKWKLKGSHSRVVVLTRVLGKPFAIIAREVKGL